jgi:hypothetical protein
MLQFGCWNINGFSSQKFDNVNIDKYNVVGVVETWTKVSQTSPFLDLQLCMSQM